MSKSSWQATEVNRYVYWLAVILLFLQALIVFTGASVRLTGSGLGCPNWPMCTDSSLTNTPEMGIHGFIEFGNRVLGVILGLYSLFVVIALWPLRSTRSDLFRMAVLLFAVVPFQAILGGVTVRTQLNPWIVAAHFIPSALAVALAAYMVKRTRDTGANPRPIASRTLVTVAWAVGILCAIVVAMGVLVTGAGPHAGDQISARNGLNTLVMSRLHAIPVWLMTAGTIYGLILARKEKLASVTRAFTFLLIVEVAQGIIGYTQFFTGLPVPLVMAHIVGLCLVITAAVFVVDSVYQRDPLPTSISRKAQPETTSVA
ncbi:COX15/CtaA family protein [Brevibacterium sp. UMB10442]|nr:COX15/CtaA family protein [Brevibacterium sp. UMB10442]